MTPPRDAALARAIARRDWERIALSILLAAVRTTQRLPPATLEDVLALLDDAPGARDD
jgi:hypothetical protein